MAEVYHFKATIMSKGRDRVVIYPPKEYQLKLLRHKGKKAGVLLVIEE